MTENTNLTSKVYNQIRDNILKGIYPIGSQLTELALAKELQVSRTPIREALHQLELNELVTLIPNKAAIVEGIGGSDIEDIYEIRSLIEGEAAKRVAERITPEQATTLEEIIDLTEFYFEKNSYEKLINMDGKFHEYLYELTGSKMLRHILTDLHSMIKNYRHTSIMSEGRMIQTLKEHRKIMEAIKNKDGDKAKEYMTEHVQNSLVNLKKNNAIK